MNTNKPIKSYKSIEGTVIIGKPCKLYLTNNSLIRTSRVININGTTIETLNTIYKKNFVKLYL